MTETTKAATIPASTQLAQVADSVANQLIEKFNQLSEEEANDCTVAAFESNSSMLNALIDNKVLTDDVICSELYSITDDDATRLLKSQQSKQSRSKSAGLSIQNFKKMASATVAVHLIRTQCGLTSNRTGRQSEGLKPLTEETQQWYAANQFELGKAIRNIQSKKSILKKKMVDGGTDEQLQLMDEYVDYETTLKSLRSNTPAPKVNEHLAKNAAKFDSIVQLLNEFNQIDKPTKANYHDLVEAITDACLDSMPVELDDDVEVIPVEE